MPLRFWSYPAVALCLALAELSCPAAIAAPVDGASNADKSNPAAPKPRRKGEKLTVPAGISPSELMSLLHEAPPDSAPEGVLLPRQSARGAATGIEQIISNDADGSLLVVGTPEGIAALRAALPGLAAGARVELRLAVQVVPILRELPATGDALKTRSHPVGEGLLDPERRGVRAIHATGVRPGQVLFSRPTPLVAGPGAQGPLPRPEGLHFFPRAGLDGRPSCRVEMRLYDPAADVGLPFSGRQKSMVRTARGLVLGRTEYLVFPTNDPADPVECYVVGVTPVAPNAGEGE